jgi:hypothetical protein
MTQTANAKLAALAGTRNHADLPHGHHCGARWSGIGTCHCGSCCVTFVGIGAFDRHRRGGQCANPTSIGMTVAPSRAYTAWTMTDLSDPEETP